MENTTEKEMVALLAVLVKRGHSQMDVIRDLNEVGFPPKRIAELVGTTSNTVNVTLNKLKKRATSI